MATDSTAPQRARAREKISRANSYADNELEALEAGEVVDHAIPGCYRWAGKKRVTAGICHLGLGNLDSARDNFRAAVGLYRDAVGAARTEPPFANSYRRIPLTLMHAMRAALFAGATGEAIDLATEIVNLDPEEGAEEIGEDIVFKPDKYYLSLCMAGAMLDAVDTEAIENLRAINDEKPSPEDLYGQGVIDFAQGIDQGDGARIESAIRTLTEYHEQAPGGDIGDAILAPDATAAVLIARHHGYDPAVESEFVPMALVTKADC